MHIICSTSETQRRGAAPLAHPRWGCAGSSSCCTCPAAAAPGWLRAGTFRGGRGPTPGAAPQQPPARDGLMGVVQGLRCVRGRAGCWRRCRTQAGVPGWVRRRCCHWQLWGTGARGGPGEGRECACADSRRGGALLAERRPWAATHTTQRLVIDPYTCPPPPPRPPPLSRSVPTCRLS